MSSTLPAPFTWLARRPVLTWLATALGLALLCWLAFFHHLGTLGLMDKTEALFVEVAHQMAERGEWITPVWNGRTFFDYPVWGYWMVGLSFRLFGVSEWAARLPVALAASSVVVAGFALLWLCAEPGEAGGRRWGRAWLGAALLALNPGWVGWGRTSVTDMFLSSAIALSLFGFFLAYSRIEQPIVRRGGSAAMAVFAAIAVLAKGPVGLVLPGLVIGVFLLAQGRLVEMLRRLPLWWCLPLFVAVAAPWYVLAARAHGMAFLGGFFGFSNLQRFSSVIYGHEGPWFFYLPWCVILLLPWSFQLPLAIVRLRWWRLGWWRRQPPRLQLAPFCAAWFLVVLLVFSAAATKLAGYILPLVPAGALLLTLFWMPLGPSPAPPAPVDRPQRIGGWLNAAVLAALAPAAALAPRWAATDPAYPGFAAALEASGLPLILAVILAATALGLAVQLWRPSALRLWLPNLAGFLALMLLVVPGLAPLMDQQRQRPLRELAIDTGRLALPGEPLWVIGYMRYSVVFYSGRTAVFRDSAERAIEDLAEGREPRDADSVLLFGEARRLREVPGRLSGARLLASRGGQQLWRVPRQRPR